MLSSFRKAKAAQADMENATFTSKELRFLWVGGVSLVAGCVAYLALFQSSSLWARPVPLPGGEDGPVGAIRLIFPNEWLQAGRGSELGLLNSGIYLLILSYLFATYWLTLRHAAGFRRQGDGAQSQISRRGRHPLWPILSVTALALFVLLWLPGTQSTDLHSYIWYGRILATFGDNPLVHVPLEYVGRDAGSWLQQVYWQDVPSVYGPVWVLLAAGVGWLGNLVSSTDMWPHLLGHKLIASCAHLVNVALMWRVSGLVARRYWRLPDADPLSPGDDAQAWRRGAQPGATLVYAWCPLALIEFGGNGHNDVLMLTGILSALWLHLTGRWRLAAAALALAALVKVVALLLLPGYLWLLFWNPPVVKSQKAAQESKPTVLTRLSISCQALLAVAGTWTLLYLPFWEGPETLRPLLEGPASQLFTNSLAAMLRYQGAEWLSALATANGWEGLAGQSVDAIRHLLEWPLRLLTSSVTVLVAVAVTWQGRTFPRMVVGWGWMLLVYLTVGAVWFWPWYVTWLLPIAGIARHQRLFRAIQLLSATSLVLYAVYPLMLSPFEQVPYYRSLIIIAPALAYLALSSLGMVVRRHGSLFHTRQASSGERL